MAIDPNNNEQLIVSVSSQTTFGNDATPQGVGDADDVQNGTAGADVYVFDNTRSGPSVGDKQFNDFGSNDSLITTNEIFDGNGDGIIVLGPNALLDVERRAGGTSSSATGTAQFNLLGPDGQALEAVRFLGSKSGNNDSGGATVGQTDQDNYYVYANAETRFALQDYVAANGGGTVVEGTVDDDTLTGTAGVDYFLYDTALGLNLGGDTVTVQAGDYIVTTSEIFNRNGNGQITFGNNGVLDLPGSEGGMAGDPNGGPGGQIDFFGTDALRIAQEVTINDVTYYFYEVIG